jgi:hypothetical protein
MNLWPGYSSHVLRIAFMDWLTSFMPLAIASLYRAIWTSQRDICSNAMLTPDMRALDF